MAEQNSRQRHAGLVYLARAMDSLSLLISTADHWQSPEQRDALVRDIAPLVRSIADRFQQDLPETVLPFTLQDDPRIDEVVEIESSSLREALAGLSHTAPVRSLSQPTGEAHHD